MADSEDYYVVLGVGRDADQSAIKRFVAALWWRWCISIRIPASPRPLATLAKRWALTRGVFVRSTAVPRGAALG